MSASEDREQQWQDVGTKMAARAAVAEGKIAEPAAFPKVEPVRPFARKDGRRGFWKRHRTKVFVAAGVLGCGYALYQLYAAHREVIQLEKAYEDERQADELTQAKLQEHLEKIRRIMETVTLPHAVKNLQSRIDEELDISHLTGKLLQGKRQPDILLPEQKLKLWESLKILSFSKITTSLWAITVLYLYTRVQFYILARHFYIEDLHGVETSEAMQSNQTSVHDHLDFLKIAGYLPHLGISKLIMGMNNAASEVVKDKQLRNPFSTTQLQEAIMQIFTLFMSGEASVSWMRCLIPENERECKQLLAVYSNDAENTNVAMTTSRLEKLISDARQVSASKEFRNIVEASLKMVVNEMMEELRMQLSEVSPTLPLANFLPRIVQLGSAVLNEPCNNKYIAVICNLPEIEQLSTPPLVRGTRFGCQIKVAGHSNNSAGFHVSEKRSPREDG